MNDDRAARAAVAAVAAFALGYLLAAPLRLPVLVYDPQSRAAFFSGAPAGMQMRYYGDLLYASGVALAAAGIAWLARPRRTRLAIASATALSLVALDALFYLARLLAAW